MRNTIVAKRYVEAYSQSFSETKAQDALDLLILLCKNIISNDDCFNALKNPLIDIEKKTKLISVVLASLGAEPKLENLFKLLLKKGRINILPDFIEEARKEKAYVKNEVVADVETSVGFDATSTALFQNYLQKQTNKKITLNIKENKEILGGFKAKVGHTVYDFTLDNAFQKLKKTFS
jgi:F-type H+-transporting ATPase subunit delta